MNCEHANPNVMSVNVKLMTGELIQVDLTENCTVNCLKKKLLENYYEKNEKIFGLDTSHFHLFYLENEEEKELSDEETPDSSKMICLVVSTDNMIQFSQKYVTSFSENHVTLDFTNFDLNDAQTFTEWLYIGLYYTVHLKSSNVFKATMNSENITEPCVFAGSYMVGDFEIHIHPSSEDPVTKDDLKDLFFSLPPNRSRSRISYIAYEGVFSDTAYTTQDFLEELYGKITKRIETIRLKYKKVE